MQCVCVVLERALFRDTTLSVLFFKIVKKKKETYYVLVALKIRKRKLNRAGGYLHNYKKKFGTLNSGPMEKLSLTSVRYKYY